MRRSVVFSFLSILVLGGCLGSKHVKPPVTIYGNKGGEGGGVHIVQQDETIYSIAKRYNLVMGDLAYANGIDKGYRIHPGQRLTLPPPPTYRVRKGDSLSEVARIFGVSTQDVITTNELPRPYMIQQGDELKLPRITAEEAGAGYAPVKMQADSKAGVGDEHQNFIVADNKPIAAPKSRPKGVNVKPPKRSSSKFLRPVNGKVISSYGAKKGGLYNDGVNILADRGTIVKAAENGVVVYAGSELKGSGNLVLVRHSDRWMTAYAHLDKIKVRRGQVLKRGQSLGTVGSTGAVDRPQLHFEVRRGTKAINPKKLI